MGMSVTLVKGRGAIRSRPGAGPINLPLAGRPIRRSRAKANRVGVLLTRPLAQFSENGLNHTLHLLKDVDVPEA